ncbi:MAG: hypothetical protein FWC36_04205 [Spirochaetes bacterium]|nr:hypothetical protein [Spirochaetota bacterium]
MKKLLNCGFFSILILVLLFSFGSCKRDPERLIFGDYPADFEIAYMHMIGYPQAPTLRDLFGTNAVFANTFYGTPSVVTVESTSGTKDEFSAVLLLTMKGGETGEYFDLLRVQLRFQPDSISEKSYLRYIRFANLATDQVTVQQSHGTEREDGLVLGFFASIMGWFWDTSKF